MGVFRPGVSCSWKVTGADCPTFPVMKTVATVSVLEIGIVSGQVASLTSRTTYVHSIDFLRVLLFFVLGCDLAWSHSRARALLEWQAGCRTAFPLLAPSLEPGAARGRHTRLLEIRIQLRTENQQWLKCEQRNSVDIPAAVSRSLFGFCSSPIGSWCSPRTEPLQPKSLVLRSFPMLLCIPQPLVQPATRQHVFLSLHACRKSLPHSTEAENVSKRTRTRRHWTERWSLLE